MVDKTPLEEALEYLINDEEDKAVASFHDFIVQKARAIHESLIEDDELDEEIDESAESSDESEEEVNEATETDDSEEVEESQESDEEETVEEGFDEFYGENDFAEEDELPGEDMVGDEEGHEEPEADEFGGEEEHEEGTVEVDVAELRDLEAKFDALMRDSGLGDEDEADDFAADEMGADEDEAGEAPEADLDEFELAEDSDDELDEKWAGSPEIKHLDKYGKGEKTKEQLHKRQTELRNKKDHTAAETQELRRINTALRARNDWKKAAEESVEEAVSHSAGVQDNTAGTDSKGEGKHSRHSDIAHNPDAGKNTEGKLREDEDFDFDLTEEDFLDLEEGLKAVSVSMGGEQGGVKFAGEETNTKSPVADKDKSDVKASPDSLVSKQKEHGTYKREAAPSNDKLPHSGENNYDHATGNKGYGKVEGFGGPDSNSKEGGEQGGKKFAGTEVNVKSPIGSAGTRNEK